MNRSAISEVLPWVAISILAASCASCTSVRTAASGPSSGFIAAQPQATNSPVIQPSADCNASAIQAAITDHLPGHPFEALASHDGCWIFVSLQLGPGRGAMVVLHRSSGALTRTRIARLPGPIPGGFALTHDGALLIVPDGPNLFFLDTDRLIHGAVPVVGVIRDGIGAGAINATTSKDDRLLFVSDESLHQVTVVDLAKARQNGFKQNAVIGRIPTGISPVGLALSSDDRYLFVTSEVLPKLQSPPTCRQRGQEGGASVPDGGLEVVSLARIRPNPAVAVVAAITAGCSPVRAVSSAQDGRLYVTARASDGLLVFDSKKLINDPAHALLATVPVGNAPVGVAVINQGRRIVVANSGRFGGTGGAELTVIDAALTSEGRAAVDGTVPVGRFPRELHTTDDGRTLIVTDFDSDDIELLRVDDLPEQQGGPN